MHFAVMAREAIEYLAVRPDGTYLDATSGLGGHTGEIARRLTAGKVIANDRDAESIEMARRNTAAWVDRICFHQGPFSRLASALPACEAQQVNGLLADLGVSRYQLTEPERGFSFLSAGPLDMRMDRSRGITAGEVLNQYAEEAIADLIYQLGEERRARKIARAIVRGRPLRSSLDLAGLVEQVIPRANHRIHPATRTFMALRMFVNDELGELDRLLEIGPELVADGGRMVVISFTSLEDRKVKQCFRALAQEGRATILTRRPLTPTEEEVFSNPPSRSAKLRAVEMVGGKRAA